MLNFLKLLHFKTNKTAAMLLMFYLLIGLNCGKRKPPLPPVERVTQTVSVSGIQKGNRIILNWTMPARNASQNSVLNIDRIDIYRLAEPSSSTLSLTEEEFISRSTLLASKDVSRDDFNLKQLSFSDELKFAGQPVRLIYGLRLVNSSGQKASFSNFVVIEPTAKVSLPPSDVESQISEENVLLNWRVPEKNIDGTVPANISGFNVYRKTLGAGEFQLLNKTPLSQPSFSDNTFTFGENYVYLVRTVSTGIEAEPVESLDSNEIEVSPKDIFPPAPPKAITIAAAPNNLSIFFATNIEKDLAGYKVFRSTERNLPKSEWENLTPEILTTNTFQDKRVVSGQTYFYYLTAIDKTGNESDPSEIVSEVAP